MNFVIDTNKLSDFFDGEETVLRIMGLADIIYIPYVVIGEYKSGAYAGTKREHNLKLLQQLLDRSGVRVLEASRQTADYYAELKYYTRKNGTPIPVNDLWIASLCVQHDLPLLTRDADFEQLPQVQRI